MSNLTPELLTWLLKNTNAELLSGDTTSAYESGTCSLWSDCPRERGYRTVTLRITAPDGAASWIEGLQAGKRLSGEGAYFTDEEIELAEKNKIILVIKSVRERSGMSLVQAKRFVDTNRHHLHRNKGD